MSKVVTGPKASLKLNGVKIAFLGGVQVNRQDSLTGIDVLDQMEKAEWAETGHDCDFSCNLFMVDENAAELFGFDPANLDDLLSQPELTMELYDRIKDKVLCTITGVKRESGTGSLEARGVWQGSWSFKGRIIKGI
jgi:hypothetical protein